MGWNSLTSSSPPTADAGEKEGDYVLFCSQLLRHGLRKRAVAPPNTACRSRRSSSRSVCGTQFHPEKSGEVGLRILSSFAKGVAAC
jgi:glutamine amidotransferase